MTRKRLLIAAPVLLLVVLAGVYKLVLAPTPQAKAKRLDGVLYTLADGFTINLAGGRYARLSVALLLSSAPAAGGESAGGLPQEPAVRAIVTDTLTDRPSSALTSRAARHALEKTLLRAVQNGTDEPITRVLLTDIAVE